MTTAKHLTCILPYLSRRFYRFFRRGAISSFFQIAPVVPFRSMGVDVDWVSGFYRFEVSRETCKARNRNIKDLLTTCLCLLVLRYSLLRIIKETFAIEIYIHCNPFKSAFATAPLIENCIKTQRHPLCLLVRCCCL
jgi:hypothetical protein